MAGMTRMGLLAAVLSAAMGTASLAAPPSTPAGAELPGSAIARAEVARLQTTQPAARVMWRHGQEVPSMVAGLRVPAAGADAEARARSFIASRRALCGVDVANLQAAGTRSMRDRVSVRYTATHQGLPVLDRQLVVTMDSAGDVLTVVNDLTPIRRQSARVLSAEQARDAALAAVDVSLAQRGADAPTTEAWVLNGDEARRVFVVSVVQRPLTHHLRVLVDAQTGAVIDIRNLVAH